MDTVYKCGECRFKFDFPDIVDTTNKTKEEICPNCRSNNIFEYKEPNDIKLTPVKTLDEWFANLPLIYKLDLYNSMSETITKHLK